VRSIDQRLGDVIRKIRLDQDLSQEKLGFKAKLSRNQIGNIERGESSATIGALYGIARALGHRASEILAEAERAG